MGKMSCTGHLHTSPIVKDPYSNCVLGTERLHGWHPPNDGRRVYERHTGPVGSGWEVRRRGGGRAGGQWAAGVMRGACRYGSGQGPVHAATRVPSPVPGAPPAPPPRGRAGSPAGPWRRAGPADPPRGRGWLGAPGAGGPPVGGRENRRLGAPSRLSAGVRALAAGSGALNAVAALADGLT
jgi:hypothetical protein